jgi:hypothetical protein
MIEKIKVGIVTTPEGVHFFKEVLNEFKHVDSTMMSYQNDRDVKEMILEKQSQLDIIVFSGPLGYHMNRKYVNEDIPTICVGYNEIELVKGLLQLSSMYGKEARMLSIDTFGEGMVAEVYEELGFEYVNVFVKQFNADEHHSLIVDFHLDLWNRKKINHVITARRSVYNTLIEKGVPVLKVLPTKFSIRDAIFKAVLLGQNSKNIESQITVCMFSMIIPSKIEKGSKYELEKLKLDFHRALVDIAHKIDASVVPSDSFEFILYTNRGNLDEIKRWLNNDFISVLERKLAVKICVGLGLGNTALSAQSHARQALKYANMQGGGCGYLVRSVGKIVGLLGSDRTLQFEIQDRSSTV